jgi:hypothetical protein
VPGRVMVLCRYHPRTRCYQPICGSGPPKMDEKPSPGPPIAEAEGPEASPAGGWDAPRGAPVCNRREKNGPALSLGAVAAGVRNRKRGGARPGTSYQTLITLFRRPPRHIGRPPFLTLEDP